ncbi:hypothetical protein BDV12DRAFT_163612 [Aspergillus spectabilis]
MPTLASIFHLAFQTAAATWPFTGLSTLFFALRSFSRIRLQKESWAWDDIVITISWMLNIVRAATLQKAINSVRNIDLSRAPDTVPPATFWASFTCVWTFVCLGIPKLGMALLVCRLFRPRRSVRLFVIISVSLLCVLGVVGFIIWYVQCDPVMGRFDRWRYPEARCWDPDIANIIACVLSGLSTLTDIGFSIWPAIMIWKLQLRLSRKLGAIAMMSMGIAASVFASLKLYHTAVMSVYRDPMQMLSRSLWIMLWSGIENDFLIIAASMPSVPLVFRVCRRIWEERFPSRSRTDSRSSLRKHDDGVVVELRPRIQGPNSIPWSTVSVTGNGYERVAE